MTKIMKKASLFVVAMLSGVMMLIGGQASAQTAITGTDLLLTLT